MIEVQLDHTTKHIDPDFERRLRECKLACKEAAGWRCEYIYPNGKRCSAVEGQLKRKRGRNSRPDGWTVMHLHGCHVDQDRLNPQPRLICLCPRHHFEFDRNAELKDQPRQYRRGYQLTSTDALIEHLAHTGISIAEMPDGYAWSIDGTAIQGQRNTAIHAVGAAIYQLRNLHITTQSELSVAQRIIETLQAQLDAERATNQSLLSQLEIKEKDPMREGMPRCTCGNLLRAQAERTQGHCFECGMRQALSQANANQTEVSNPETIKVAETVASAK